MIEEQRDDRKVSTLYIITTIFVILGSLFAVVTINGSLTVYINEYWRILNDARGLQ